jgi:kumamolisin
LRESRRELPASFAQLLYTLAETPANGVFHDVVTGGNRFYDATPGWDYVTGLGSPDVEKLLSAAQ